MKPTKCPLCHSDDLAHGYLGPYASLFYLSFFRVVSTKASACLACGAVIPFLESAAIDKLRNWNAKASSTKVVDHELPPIGASGRTL